VAPAAQSGFDTRTGLAQAGGGQGFTCTGFPAGPFSGPFKGAAMKYAGSAIAALLIFLLGNAAASDGSVARVKTVKGPASIVRGQSVVPAVSNERVFQGDTLKTGADGSLGVVFNDDTLISLGPNSELVVDAFLYAPAEGKLSIVTRMLRGTAAYVSGMIAKLSPQSARIETPVATIGIRGTRLLVKVDGD